MTVLALAEPCSKVVNHAPHQIRVVNPHTSTLAFDLACPGWDPKPPTPQGDQHE
jgi:hypothetical protein